jgi:hypothetical protein
VSDVVCSSFPFHVPQEIGEFCYEINVDVGLPKAVDRLDFSTHTGVSTNKTMRICSKNLAFEKAFTLLADMRIKNPNKKIKARSVLQNFISSPVASEETGHSNFAIEFLASFFQYKKLIPFVSEYVQIGKAAGSPQQKGKKELVSELSAHSNRGGGVGGGGGGKKTQKILKTLIEDSTPEDFNPMNESQMLNSCLLSFYPEKAGHYSTLAVVYAKDNLNDVRVLEVNAKATMPDGKMVIEFRGPSRELISQDIPVINESDKEWFLTTSLKGDWFSGPKNLVVPRKGSATLQISFVAPHVGRFEGSLQLRNPEASDTFEYALVGLADEVNTIFP